MFRNKKVRVVVAAAALLVGTVAWMMALDEADVYEVDESVVSTTPIRPLLPSEQAALALALSPGLNEPARVQWEWLPLNMQTFSEGKGRYCGYLNAKNGDGVYIGFQPFLAAVRTARNEIRSGELALVATDDEALQTVRRMCAEAGYQLR